MRTSDTHRCVRCSKRYHDTLSASVCCLFAPKPMGFCAWCGTDLPRGSFCSQACGVSYRDDVLESAAALRRPKRRHVRA